MPLAYRILFLGVIVVSILVVNGARFGLNIKYHPIHLASTWQKTPGQIVTLEGNLAVVKDNDHVIYIKKGQWDSTWTTAVQVRLDPLTALLEVELINGLPPETILALAQKLVGKRLPYGAFFCNEIQYTRFLFGGEVYRSWYRRDCLTNLSLDGVTPEDINTAQFALKDGNNQYYTVDRLPPFRSHNNRSPSPPRRRNTRWQ